MNRAEMIIRSQIDLVFERYDRWLVEHPEMAPLAPSERLKKRQEMIVMFSPGFRPEAVQE